MIKYITTFEGANKQEQMEKVLEEANEFIVEVLETKDNYKADQEGADLIQTVFTYWMNKGYKTEDIEAIFKAHYEKETRRGRTVSDIPGVNYYNGIIKGLLKKIAQLEKQVRILQLVNKVGD